MSCHYSCATCISQLFADQCLSCPATRQLIDTTCFCASSYYEYQLAACRPLDQLTRPDYFFNIIAQIIYWIMLGFSWLIVLGNLNHLYSAKVRVLVGWSQLLALLLDYRFRFTTLAEKALDVFGVWNFRYFDQLFCTQKSKPYMCQSYQNLIGPLLTLATFFVAMVVSYILTKTCILSIFTQQEDQPPQAVGQVLVIGRKHQTHHKSTTNSITSMSFTSYMRISLKQFFLLYIDYSIIQWTVQLSRIASTSSYMYILYIPLIVFMLLYTLYGLKVINSASQFKVQYRSQFGYFYIYDQKYYLNYLDYLIEEERRAKGNGDKVARYLPHSTYLMLEMWVKFFIAATTVIMFQYKPQLWVFPALFALVIGFIKLKVFQVYERQALLCYWLGFIFYLISVALFFLQYFFTIWMVFLMFAVSTTFFVLLISELSDWTRVKEGKYWKVAFEYLNGETEDEHLVKGNDNRQVQLEPSEENSQEDLIKTKENNFDRVVRSGEDTRVKTDQQMKNIAANIIVGAKPSFKKNLNATQIKSQSNQNFSQTINSNPKDLLQVMNPNIDTNPQPYQQSFMTRTNRSKFAALNSNQTFQNTKPLVNSSEGSMRGINKKKNGQNDRLPEITEQDSVDGRSIQDVKRVTNTNYAKGETQQIQDLDNNESNHAFNRQPDRIHQPQQNSTSKTSGKMPKLRYKK